MSRQKPEIQYPCEWSYTLIGLSADDIRDAAGEVFGNRSVTLSPSKKSRTGKYVSMYATLTVDSQQQRDSFFAALSGHDAIRMAL
jgi:putative lipoic acid-binding regulatory protein